MKILNLKLHRKIKLKIKFKKMFVNYIQKSEFKLNEIIQL